MATKVVANINTRIIEVVEAPVGGLQELDVVTDIYSPLKADWQSDLNLQKLAFPFRSTGDPIGGGVQIGPYTFFENQTGWRFLPFDVDHELTLINGNIIKESAVEGTQFGLWLNRSGRTINIRDQFSAQSLLRVAGGGLPPTVDQIADAVWDEDIVASHGTQNTAGLTLSQLTKRNTVLTANLANDSIISQMIAKTVVGNYSRATDSLEALGEKPSLTAIADAVWDEDLVAAHGGANTAGLILSELTRRTINFTATMGSSSVIGQIVSKTFPGNFVRTTDSLEALGELPSAATISDAVWDEDIVAAHSGTNTTGLILSELTRRTINFTVTMGSGSVIGQMVSTSFPGNYNRTTDSLEAIGANAPPTAAAIADAVWDEDIVAAHGALDTAGFLLSAFTRRSVSFTTSIAGSSILGQIVSIAAPGNYNRTTDSLEALGALPSATAIADAVWDEDIVVAHGTLDTAGYLLSAFTRRSVSFMASVSGSSIIGQIVSVTAPANYSRATDSLEALGTGGAAPTPEEIADAVWDEDATDHQTQGTFGQAIGDPGTDPRSIWTVVTDLRSFIEGGREIDFAGSDLLGWQRIERDVSGTLIRRYNLFDENNNRIDETVMSFVNRMGMISREVPI